MGTGGERFLRAKELFWIVSVFVALALFAWFFIA